MLAGQDDDVPLQQQQEVVVGMEDGGVLLIQSVKAREVGLVLNTLEFLGDAERLRE